MSDLCHEDVPEEFIQQVFDVMNATPRHTYQVLTKRAERLSTLWPSLSWGENIWMGVSIENADYTYRIDPLREVPAHVRFISFEPLIGPVGPVDLSGIGWVIVGGESGPKHRPMQADWAREIRDQCLSARIPFFFKQVGGLTPKAGGCLLDGREWKEYPSA